MYLAQRAARFTEAGIHHWFRSLKARANKEEWSLIQDLNLLDYGPLPGAVNYHSPIYPQTQQ
jgi:hypothetical protein